MERRINRRQALAGMGSVSLGALLAACGSDGAQVTDADGIVEFTTGVSSCASARIGR